MRKLYLTVILISCMVMLSVAAGGARTQSKKPLTGSAKDFERAKFDKSSTHISNQWMPLKPGTKLIYKGSAIPEGEKTRVKRRAVTIVTDLSKWIDGVRTLVIWEKDYSAGKLGESEIAF